MWRSYAYILIVKERTYFGPVTLMERAGGGPYEPCFVVSEFGRIPGKCTEKECWFPYGGLERTSGTWEPIVGCRSCPVHLVPHSSSSTPPEGTVNGKQNDMSGPIYSAIADTEWGAIPGKAIGDTCWFSYDGKEMETSNFSWVVKIPG